MPGCCIGSNAASSNAVRSFWLLGLLNNSPWVLMLAVATNISAGGVALVFLANQIPGLLVKVSAPYWFHRVSYRTRMLVTAVTMGTACFLVGCGGLYRDEMAESEAENNDQTPKDADGQSWGLALELFGVSFVSFSCSLGESSLLALAGKFDSEILPKLSSSNSSSYLELSEEQITTGEGGDHANNDALQQDSSEGVFTEEYDVDANHNGTSSEENESKLMKKGDVVHQRRSITAFSSGTGMAGVAGYAYKAFFSDLLGWSFSATVWSAMILAVAYYTIYLKGLYTIEQDASTQSGSENGDSAQQTSESSLLVTRKNEDNNNSKGTNSALEMVHTDIIHNQEMQQFESPIQTDASVSSPHDLTSCERFTLVLSLWRYTIPLFTVYAAEYMLQAGVWSAIGFPVTSASARAQFYHYSNWVYQAGVFLSRSSGNLCTASLKVLWLMPFLQVVNLYFFWLNSIHHFWYDYTILVLCFFVGLLGGGVYVQGFSRVNMDMPPELKEFALASVSVADSLGIMFADIMSLYIQSCIYKMNNVEGAVVDCPY